MNGNNGKCGKLFVIEGLDGCGKSTQLEMLKASADSNIRFISFPNYNSASGEIIKDYLSGKFCEENGRTGAYTAGSFYAIDRYISYKTDWEKDYKAGKTIIAARYTSSNVYIRWQSWKSPNGTSTLSGLRTTSTINLQFHVPKESYFWICP